MKKWITLCIFGLMLAHSSHAAAMTMNESISNLKQKWAVINYQMTDKEQKEKAIGSLADQATQLSQANPDRAEPLIWQANILCTKAGIEADTESLTEVEKARDLLLQAIKINPQALNGFAYTLLGWLYHKVPGWPVGFGDDDQAQEYLEKAVDLNPNGLDVNFFYGSFLYDQEQYPEAKTALENGLKSPPHQHPTLAEKGRREEIQNLLQKLDTPPP